MPNVRISNSIPNIRISNFQTGRAGEQSVSVEIPIGSPIGLLLVLTHFSNIYSSNGTLLPYSDFRPNARITSQ